MEEGASSLSNSQPPSRKDENSETTGRPNRPSSVDPLSQDEVNMFLSSSASLTSIPTWTTGEGLISSTEIEDVPPSPIVDDNPAIHTPPFPSIDSTLQVPSQFPHDPSPPDLSGLTISDRMPIVTPVEDHQIDSEDEQEYTLKEIFFNGCARKIMTQNVNGPCPLIAVVNALVLKGKLAFNHDEWKVSLTRVLDAVAEKILIEKEGREDSEALDANVESALETLRHSPHGLDVNVRFGKVDDFEFTAVHSIFDVLDLDLFHGWIADEGTLSVIGNRAYNEITASITEDSNEARLIKEWLDFNQSQLTFEGLNMLRNRLTDGGVAIMFRNNHFTTITKHDGTLFILLTDMGFISLDLLVFESLVDINQSSSYFTNGNFEEVNADGSVKETNHRKMKSPSNGERGDTTNDEDLAFAVSLQEEEMKLERERNEAMLRSRNEDNERRRQQQAHHEQAQRLDVNQRKKSSCSMM